MKKYFVYLNVFLLLGLLFPGMKHSIAALPETDGNPTLQIISSNDKTTASTSIPLTQTSEWTLQNPLLPNYDLKDVWGSDPNNIFAVGEYGTIGHYDGTRWSPMTSGVTETLYAVWGSSNTNVFAVGTNGTILRFDGMSWSKMHTGTNRALRGIWGADAHNIFAVGEEGTILQLQSGSWIKRSSGVSVTLYDIWGTDSDNLFAVGGNTIIHHNGETWHYESAGQQLKGLWGSGRNDIFAVGDGIWHFDGGIWTEISVDTTIYQLQDIWGTSADNVFVVGHGGWGVEQILHYDGNGWQEISDGIFQYLFGVWGSSSNSVVAVGWDGTILNYNGSSWTRICGDDASFGDIWGSGPNDVFAVGDGIWHYDGQQWSMMGSGTTKGLSGIWGSSSTDVFAVGATGTIQHYNGVRWRSMESGTDYQLSAVWGSSSDDVFAVGSSNDTVWEGIVLHYDGEQWKNMDVGGTAYIFLDDVWGSSANDVFVVGTSTWGANVTLHYDGNSWHEIDNGTVRWGIWGTSPSDIFFVGETIEHYDGVSWEVMDDPAAELYGVWGVGSTDVFAVGGYGNIVHYDGNGWHRMNSGTSMNLSSIWGSGPNDVFAVGESGTILHYDIQPQRGTINGRVTSTTSDLGLSNVIVTAQTYSTTTDLNGNYSLVVSPGVYQVKAKPDAGMDYYANQRSFITVDNGESVNVDLKLSPIISDTVDTLILANLQRMKEIGYDAGAVNELETKIGELQSTHPDDSNMTAIFTDLGESVSPEIDAAYTAWDGNEGDVIKTNDLVDSIDAYIESLKQGDYPNLEYVIIVGSHEVIPMKARAADSGEENEWAETPGHLPVHSGYLYEIYRSQEKGARGHYLTDSQYGDLSFIDNGDTRGCDGELVPEIYVGRLVETPSQIAGLVDAYISNQGILSREKMVSIASVDLLDSGTVAAEYMGGTADLIQLCFSSHAVVEKMEENPGIVYLAGHSDYYRTVTCKSGEISAGTFHAGTQAGQGSVQDISVDLPGTLIVSVGCHNGLNLGNQLYQAPDGESQWSDFPEEFAKKEVGVFFGSTGIALGSESGEGRSHHTVGNSERLATNILYFLLNGNNVSAGEAFKDAINFFVVHNEVCGDEQNRVLAIATLYGFPHYRLPSNVTITVSGSEANLRMSTLTQNTWPIEVEIPSWKLSERGVVTIPSVSYMDNINTPILPVISLRRLLPTGSSFTSVSWNQNESESITMTNDVPLPVIGMPTIGTGENITLTGTFTYTGDYPEFPYFTTDISDVGGGRWINLQIVPVQYNQTTHITRIWTRLSFDVEYDIASSVDSDGDGLPDYWEKAYGLDPLNDSGDSGSDADIDGDGLTNAEEYSYSTNPTSADTDGDGVQDLKEIGVGTDPNNPFSKADLVFLPIVTRNY